MNELIFENFLNAFCPSPPSAPRPGPTPSPAGSRDPTRSRADGEDRKLERKFERQFIYINISSKYQIITQNNGQTTPCRTSSVCTEAVDELEMCMWCASVSSAVTATAQLMSVTSRMRARKEYCARASSATSVS